MRRASNYGYVSCCPHRVEESHLSRQLLEKEQFSPSYPVESLSHSLSLSRYRRTIPCRSAKRGKREQRSSTLFRERPLDETLGRLDGTVKVAQSIFPRLRNTSVLLISATFVSGTKGRGIIGKYACW